MNHTHDLRPFLHAHAFGDAAAPRRERALWWVTVITLVTMALELAVGYWSGSLALVADAGHMLTDVAALGLSLFTAMLARRPADLKRTYGYVRWEILAALINGATLLLISAWIVVEAFTRFRHPEPVVGGTMLAVAILGFAVNGVAVWLLHGVREGSLNVRGAYLHMLGDTLASGGTVVAALVIRYTGWLAADPVASLVTTVLIITGAWRLVKESVDVLLEAAPSHIDLDGVRSRLESIGDVESVHDLHVWTVTSGMVAMSAHAIVRDSGCHQRVLENAHDALQAMGIQHVTIQLECVEMDGREANLHP